MDSDLNASDLLAAPRVSPAPPPSFDLAKRRLIRLTFLLHRYLGIGLGLLMVMWCLSGIVMMYVSYPALDAGLRLRALSALDWRDCCVFPDAALGDGTPVRAFEVEMLGGHPVLQISAKGRTQLFDLRTGQPVNGMGAAQALPVARDFARAAGLRGTPAFRAVLLRDQWTVDGGFNRDRPLLLFAMNDSAGTRLYVSSPTGRAVQVTTARERFWNWLGAVPHWLYLTQLRQDVVLWAQIVIWTSLLGCFLTITGLYAGIRQIKRRRSTGHLASPYRGFMAWHHVPGLVFGVFALTWVASGLFSMNPWGLWESSGAGVERDAMQGAAPDWSEAKAAITALGHTAGPAFVTVRSAPLGGKLYLVGETADGKATRLDAAAAPAPLNDADRARIAEILRGRAASASTEILDHEDEYYFSHHRDLAPLPVFRVVQNGGDNDRFYIDPVSGALLGKIDSDRKYYRWMQEGLHRLDFTASIRARPVWDILMLPLLLGATFVCATGAYLGYRNVTGRSLRKTKRPEG